MHRVRLLRLDTWDSGEGEGSTHTGLPGLLNPRAFSGPALVFEDRWRAHSLDDGMGGSMMSLHHASIIDMNVHFWHLNP